jgi:CheY-like chemotaxis protein
LPLQLKGHVLIAEDTPELQLLERRILESIGLTVEIAVNGREAIEKWSGNTFDLILMDMQMPEMDGIEATSKLREMGCKIPIVALTANVMEKHRKQFGEAGGSGFLEKPIDRQVLIERLQQELGQASKIIRG